MQEWAGIVSETTVTKILISIINILVLVLPIIALGVLVFFLPWYFIKRTHLINKKMELEEEKINNEENKLKEK